VHSLGETRSSSQPNHLLQTPDAFVRCPMPGLEGGVAIIHISPAIGARFTEYTAELAPSGTLLGTEAQRFVYVLSGSVELSAGSEPRALEPGGYAYVPAGQEHRINAVKESRIAVIEKPYQPLGGVSPSGLVTGRETDVGSTALLNDDDVQVRSLLPDNPQFDFAVNTMTYQPGASLSQVEIHVMEHGLMMLEGSGIYRLGDCWYPVITGDVIWMGPFCPQWFGALGKAPAKYLIYKDWNRHPNGARA
jgi:(S)-ureidoglycine aminohydrolase